MCKNTLQIHPHRIKRLHNRMATSTYSAPVAAPVTKIGAHHLAYLRALAEGVAQHQAAARYLGHDMADGATALRQLHNTTVDRVRALARRLGDARWRLIGLKIRPQQAEPPAPSIDEWAHERAMDGFSQAELLLHYAEAFPADRKAQRQGRLRSQQLALLQSLAQAAVEPALPHHRLDAWFPAHLCKPLMASGLLLLADLQSRVRAGGRWWRSMPTIGVGKAARLAHQLDLLIPGSMAPPRKLPLAWRGQSLAAALATAPVALPTPPALPSTSAVTDDGHHHQPNPRNPTIDQLVAGDLQTDALAVRAWIQARAGSSTTEKAYRRELARFLLFLDLRGRTLSICTADDGLAYQALLQDVPADWSARRTAPLGHDAWAPFAGPLCLRSQRQAVAIVRSCLAWLVAARYLPHHPWPPIDRRTDNPPDPAECTSRVMAPLAWQAICASLDRLAGESPAAERMVFLLQFLEATGLRATELLGARLGDLRWLDGRLQFQVPGKGRRQRVIPVVGQAQRALARYLAARGLDLGAIESRPLAPLLANVKAADAALTYRSLYGSMKTWLNKAIDGSGLPWADKVAAARASPHWLRHRCGTRALERGASLAVVAQWLGHADTRTTARYSPAPMTRISDEMEKGFG
jgi:site-specific recombinase XerD